MWSDRLEERARLGVGGPRLVVAAERVLQFAQSQKHVGLAQAVSVRLEERARLGVGGPRLVVAIQ